LSEPRHSATFNQGVTESNGDTVHVALQLVRIRCPLAHFGIKQLALVLKPGEIAVGGFNGTAPVAAREAFDKPL
jgi:hypothetical protein